MHRRPRAQSGVRMTAALRLVTGAANPSARVTPIRDWTKTERPRERLLDIGAGSLSDAELFALFLHSGVPGWTAVDLARELLQHFGTLRSVLDASATQLCALRGIGPARAAQLLAVSELCRRALAESARDRMKCSCACISMPDINCCWPRNRHAARSRASRFIRVKSCGGRCR
jgi:DNA repair protein RadC